MNNEVQLIIPDKYGISEENSNVIAKNCIPIIQEFNKLEIDYDSIMSEKEMTEEICKKSKSLRNKYVKVRTGGDRVIQLSKESIKKQVDAHDQLRRDFKETISERENKLREKELYFEQIEEEKRVKIHEERTAELSKYDKVYDAGDIALMDGELWGHFLRGVKADYEAKKAEEARIEKERIEAQKKEDLFYARKEKLIQFSQFNIQNELSSETTKKEFIDIVEKGEKMKAEFKAEQKRIKAENERLKKEREEKRIADEKAEIERQRLAKIEQDKRDKIERERQAKAEAERKQREEKEAKERAAHELELKSERAAKERLQKEFEAREEIERKRKETEQLDLIRIQKEKEAESDAKRKAELAPDKERMTKWIADMTIIDIVNDRMSKESVLMASEIIDKYNLFKKWATERVNEIK